VIRERDRVRRRLSRVHDAAIIRKSVGLDLGKLHHSLFSLERELSSLTSAGQSLTWYTIPVETRLRWTLQASDQWSTEIKKTVMNRLHLPKGKVNKSLAIAKIARVLLVISDHGIVENPILDANDVDFMLLRRLLP